MAITDEGGNNGFVMPVSPLYGGGYGGNNGGFFGGDWAWILLLLLIGGGGWGMGGFGGGAMWPMMMIGGGMGGFGLDYLYPWLNNSQHISDGFRDQNLQTSINGLQNSVTAGFGDVQNALCSGFAGVNAGIANAASQAEISANARQMANMQQLFGLQTANAQGFNGVNAGISDLRYTVATEACADRAAVSDGIRDLLAATQAQTQTILTQLCNDKIEQKNDTIAQLRQELMFARGQASQDVQTARILAGQTAETDAVYTRLSQCPVGTVPVFGNQPIFTCPTNVGNNCGCGCGCNG